MPTNGAKVERSTLQSVARRAAVSRQTVSNVMNAPHLVRPDTLRRVRAVIDEVGYRPHRAARTLRTRRSYLIAVRMEPPKDGINGVVLDRFLHALTSDAQDLGYRVLLFTSGTDEYENATYAELLDDHDLDGFVLTGTHIADRRTAWLRERNVPFVTFGRPWGEPLVTHGWVDVDGAAGTAAATRHLLAVGHQRIAYLGRPGDHAVADDRRRGWSTACRESARLCEELAVEGPDSLLEGRAATAALLDRADPPTAIVCASDSVALGAWTEITARGLRPGPDVAVIGFDDSPTAAVVGLTSIAQPLHDVARTCLGLLHEVLTAATAPAGPPPPVLLPPHLVLRDSG
jgi:DNA-binding LacI/PurR family transcriptional regulator